MALQHLRSSTANKRPTPGAMSDGQLALNTNLVSPGLFFKDSNGDTVKIGPVHVGTTAPNVSPAVGGEAGNSLGEAWLDTTAANPILKVFDGSAFVAVQPVGTGTVVSTTDTGSVTSTMILDGTILNADINASAAIVDTKLDTIATAGKVSNSATTATNANTASAIVARDASGNFTAGTITAAVTGAASSNVLKAGDTMTGALVVPLASAATPSLTFTGDLDTGLYSPGTDQVGISTGGTARVIVDSNGATLNGQGDLRFADSDSSHFIALQAPATITTNVTLTLPSADGTSEQFLSTNGSGTLSFASGGATGLADGSAATPSVNYSADTNTGIFRAGNDRLAFSTGGVSRGEFTAAGQLDLTNDALINGLTVGKGLASILSNTALGANALAANTSGSNNLATGYEPLFSNTTGSDNVAAGNYALHFNTTGGTNTANGVQALYYNTTGSSNTANGYRALFSNTTGNDNVATGFYALRLNTEGSSNTATGIFALDSNTTASYNTANGYQALYLNTTGSYNTANGYVALYTNTTGASNTATGYGALYSNTTGNYNVVNGGDALYENTTASYNVANGYQALRFNTTGGNNTAIGYAALYHNTTASDNTATGTEALANNTTGTNNVANGYRAFYSNTTGSSNTANGYQALYSNSTGYENTANGHQALYAVTTGFNNTGVGRAGLSNITTGSNNTAIGFNAQASSATVSNTITLGNSGIATLRCQQTSITSLSDARDKTNIVDLPAGLDFINALRPVAFDWNQRDGARVGIHDFGFIAQELQEAQATTGITVPNLVYTDNPDKLEASAGTLLPVLVNAVKELTAMVSELQSELAILKGA